MGGGTTTASVPWWQEAARFWIPILALGVPLVFQLFAIQRQLGEVRTEVATLRADMATLRADMQEQMATLRADMQEQIGGLGERIARLETLMEVHLEAHRTPAGGSGADAAAPYPPQDLGASTPRRRTLTGLLPRGTARGPAPERRRSAPGDGVRRRGEAGGPPPTPAPRPARSPLSAIAGANPARSRPAAMVLRSIGQMYSRTRRFRTGRPPPGATFRAGGPGWDKSGPISV